MIISLKASNCTAYDEIQAPFIGLRIMAFFWVTIFVTRLEMTETLMTRLINGNAGRNALLLFSVRDMSCGLRNLSFTKISSVSCLLLD